MAKAKNSQICKGQGCLFLIIRFGDDESKKEAAEKVIRNNKGLVYKTIPELMKRHKVPWRYKKELVQEGLLALRGVIGRFEPERGYTFSTYAISWIEGFFLNWRGKHFNEALKKPREDRKAGIADFLRRNSESASEEAILRKLNAQDCHKVLQEIRNVLTERDWDILGMRQTPMTLREIGIKYKLTREGVRKILIRASSHARRLLKERGIHSLADLGITE
jgi:RNA polymerase sigma factor (sigma-70 family)